MAKTYTTEEMKEIKDKARADMATRCLKEAARFETNIRTKVQKATDLTQEALTIVNNATLTPERKLAQLTKKLEAATKSLQRVPGVKPTAAVPALG